LFPCAPIEPPWDVGVEGYNKYLRLWSNGPDADQAWWWARVQYTDACEAEFEGTEEEYVATSETMKAFLEKFPKSRFAPEAEKTMKEAMDELRSILKSRKEKNPQ
jgi:outer membrane protein assembly factor BamD (BamD/ComL family)